MFIGSERKLQFPEVVAVTPRTTVVVPTIGRREQLGGTLAAIYALDPAPDAVIVVDQSQAGTAREVAAASPIADLKIEEDHGRGAARARNRGALAADEGLILFTDDDCHPRDDWVGIALLLHERHRDAIITGMVSAGGERSAVPSVRTAERPYDYTGTRTCAALYSGNMIVDRTRLLEAGGFDERFPSAGGEDNDLCYRWLRAGGELFYEPSLEVVHIDWRSPGDMAAVRREYARTQGMFYAKHLRRGDAWILRFILGDMSAAFRARVLRQPSPPPGAPAILEELRSLRRSWQLFASRA